MQPRQIKTLSNETLGNFYEALFGLLAYWGEVQTIYGWESPQWVIEAETFFLQVEAEMVIRAPAIPPPATEESVN